MKLRQSQFPKDWEIKTIGEVSEIMNGGTPDTTVPKFWDGENLWITPKDMGKLESIYVENTIRKITDDGLKNSSAKILPPNSIILSSRAPIGHLAINTKPISTNQGCKGLVPKKGVNTLFLYYFLSKSVELLNSLGTGATFKELSGSKLSTIEIPLPPLPKQQRIVSILDEAFTAIAKAKANAEQNLRNAKELFESYLQRVFEKKGDGWEEKTLGEVFQMRPQKSEVKNRLQDKDYVTFLPMEDLGIGQIEVSGVKRKELKDVYSGYTYFAENDVLLAKITPCFENGKLGIARNLVNGVGFGSSEYFVFRSKDIVQPEYLYYFLSQNEIKEGGKKSMGGAVGHQRVSKEWIEGFSIPFPKSLAEQQKIIHQLDALREGIKKLEAIYQQKINDLEELKKSVLQKAFNGELKTEYFKLYE